jgi:hypothetical protein
MTDLTLQQRQVLQDNFPIYAHNCLKILTKSRGLQRMTMNRAQVYAHNALESQLETQGYVRALILKGRQQGMSTYIGGRFYQKVTHRLGVSAFILTHRADTTQNLFAMTSRYHEHCPVNVKPSTRSASSTELWFDKLDSRYKVGTAGGDEVGRGTTIQYFHGSEVAFWENADLHLAGIFQAIPSGLDAVGTEVILESTANGVGNAFFTLWKQAEKGIGEYIAIFVPWFWQDEYRALVPKDWAPDEENAEYGKTYGLDFQQLRWRELKLIEFKADYTKFRQEYPGNAIEAFESSGEDVFISSDIVMKARKCEISPGQVYGPRIGACDPARFGDDKTAFVLRVGRELKETLSFANMDTMQVVGKCIELIERWDLDRLFIDVVGLGAGIYDRLKEMGYCRGPNAVVKAVNAAESPRNQKKFLNKRAEMWSDMKDWLGEAPCKIPDRDDLHSDLTRLKYEHDSSGRLKLEGKKALKKRGVPSPDIADALSLTFAFPVAGSVRMTREGGAEFRAGRPEQVAESNDANPFEH